MLRLSFILSSIILLAGEAHASCVCRCVDGEMQAICSSTIDIAPICPPTACGMAPPSIAPIQRMQMAPLGTQQCSQRQVWDPATRRYQWQRMCE